MEDRDTQILAERISGDTLREIGERHGGLTPEGVRVVVAREGRKQIDELEGRLLLNRKTGDVELYVIPDHSGPEFDLAIAYFAWSLRELEKRDVQVRVHYRPVDDGVIWGIEDVTDYEGGAA
jgi:hypothetical protein